MIGLSETRRSQEKPAKPPKRVRPAPTTLRLEERDVFKQIIDYLQLRGWSVYRFHVGVYAPISGVSPVRMNARGTADLLAMRNNGELQAVWIEVKAPGKRPRAEQTAWLERQRELGFDAAWFDSLERCKKWFEGRFEDSGKSTLDKLLYKFPTSPPTPQQKAVAEAIEREGFKVY